MYLFLIRTEAPFIQEVSGVYNSLSLNTDLLRVALHSARTALGFYCQGSSADFLSVDLSNLANEIHLYHHILYIELN